MLGFRRKRVRHFIPPQVNQFCREHPGYMYLATTFIAVYHSGTDKVLIIPINDPNMTNEEAESILQTHLEKYNATIK